MVGQDKGEQEVTEVTKFDTKQDALVEGVGGSFDTRPTAGIHCAIPLLKSKSF